MKKILIVHTAFIGDVVLATPLIEAVKDLYPESKVDFLAIPATADVLKNNPNLRDVIVYDKKEKDRGLRRSFQVAKQLRRGKYDLAIVPHRSLRSALIVAAAGIKKRIGFDRSAGAFLFTEKAVYHEKFHEVERNLSLLRLSNEEIKKYKPKIYPDKDDIANIEKYLRRVKIRPEGKFVAIAPGSIWATKRWTEQGFVDVVKMLVEKYSSLHVFLIGGKQDNQLCERIACKFDEHVHNTAGLFSLRQSAFLISRCSVLLSNDSGPMHLGVAAATKVIALFGPTVPAFGFSPYGEGHVVIERAGLYCRPCHIHGPKKCPEGHFRCMKEITADVVFQAVYSSLKFGQDE